MKRIGLLIVCMLGVLSAHAQWSVSPEVGLSAFRRNTYYEWRPAIIRSCGGVSIQAAFLVGIRFVLHAAGILAHGV